VKFIMGGGGYKLVELLFFRTSHGWCPLLPFYTAPRGPPSTTLTFLINAGHDYICVGSLG
jgi:hypothetical protein